MGIIFGLLFIVGAILVWLQLLVRSALIYILVVMAPLGFATRAHPGTRHVARRTVEMGVALIVSKFGVAVAFGVGAAAVESGNPAEGGDLSSMMTGVAVMLMAAFMPWVIWKAIPVVEGAAVAGGVERAPVRGVVSAGVDGGRGRRRLHPRLGKRWRDDRRRGGIWWWVAGGGGRCRRRVVRPVNVPAAGTLGERGGRAAYVPVGADGSHGVDVRVVADPAGGGVDWGGGWDGVDDGDPRQRSVSR